MTITDDDLQRIAKWFGDMIIDALDRHSAEARSAAIGQMRKQRVVVQSQVGTNSLSFETVIDEGTSAAELYGLLAPFNATIDRLKSRIEIDNINKQMLMDCDELELAAVVLRDIRRGFDQQNRQASSNRRIEVGINAQQIKALNDQRDKINKVFARIDRNKEVAAEHQRVLEGVDPLEFRRAEVDRRVDALRGQRVPPEEAA